jgi:aminoglycoside 6'-N-acetyltransferase I
MIERCTSREHPGWLDLRRALWPYPASEHLAEMEQMCGLPARFGVFVAYDDARGALGFVEVSVRGDYVNGTESSPVGFVEGIYVVEAARNQGVARALIEAAESWVRANGCSELASDALLDNVASHAAHRALGFVETERVVYFRKRLAESG